MTDLGTNDVAPASGPQGPEPSASRRQWLRFAGLGAGLVLLLAVGIGLVWSPAVCACTPPLPTPGVTSPAVGVIVSVDSAGLTQVRGFVLRVDGGWAFDFALGTLENATEFSPAHLAEHMASSEPVRVHFRVEGGSRVAYRIEDAE